MTPSEYHPLARYLCPECQRAWVSEKGATCEECYAKAWDARMAQAVREEKGVPEDPPPVPAWVRRLAVDVTRNTKGDT
jgi:hypothetical protein